MTLLPKGSARTLLSWVHSVALNRPADLFHCSLRGTLQPPPSCSVDLESAPPAPLVVPQLLFVAPPQGVHLPRWSNPSPREGQEPWLAPN